MRFSGGQILGALLLLALVWLALAAGLAFDSP